MSSTKMIAFLLGLAGLAGLLFFGYLAAAAPFSPIPPPPPLDGLPPVLFSLVLFMMSAPLAAIPGFAGLGLWFFVIRRREAALEREASVLAQRETAVQTHLDDLVQRLLELGGDVSRMSTEVSVRTRDLEEAQRGRLLRFLSECEARVHWGQGERFQKPAESGSADWNARSLGMGLLVFGGFCFLWACFLMFAYLATDVGPLLEDFWRNLGIELPPQMRPVDRVVSSLGCLTPGLAALLGWLALRWLLRREEGRRRRLAAFRQRAQEIAAEGCLRRIGELLPQYPRIARADVVCTLPELDGTGKGRLIARLQALGMLSRVDLRGADLREAVLTKIDLPGVIFTGSDLSGAVLAGARLTRADLCGSRLFGADLREADATGAVLRQADLRQARLHRCLLREADLQGADLEGANLWQADLAGANLAEARIPREQLRATREAVRP